MYEELIMRLLEDKSWIEQGTTETEHEIADHLQKAVNAIEELSKERKTGKWIKMSDADGVYWACSECGEDIPRELHYNPQFDLFPRLESMEKTNFCPNCGAYMGVVKHETD